MSSLISANVSLGASQIQQVQPMRADISQNPHIIAKVSTVAAEKVQQEDEKRTQKRDENVRPEASFSSQKEPPKYTKNAKSNEEEGQNVPPEYHSVSIEA